MNRWGRIAALGAALAAMGVLPAAGPVTAGPVPPACDPTVSGVAMPGCPSVLLGDVGDVEHPTIALPDLVPDVTEVYVDYETLDFDHQTGGYRFGPPRLNFDTHARNEGLVPLDVRADEPEATVEGSPVSQCISWTTNLVCRERRSIGGFVWHQEHVHYHFEQFAAYELRRVDEDGEVDFSEDGLLATSPKVSLCLVDSVRVLDDAPLAPRYNTCNPMEEGISPGWADVYATGLDGQSLSLEGLDDGRYALIIALNTAGRIHETNPTNNRVVAIVEIAKLGTFFPAAGIVQKSNR